MKWPQYSHLYKAILNSITLHEEDITYIECMYSVLDGLAEWWVWDEEFISFVEASSAVYNSMTRRDLDHVKAVKQRKRTQKGVKNAKA